jgi:hypothetical protein
VLPYKENAKTRVAVGTKNAEGHDRRQNRSVAPRLGMQLSQTKTACMSESILIRDDDRGTTKFKPSTHNQSQKQLLCTPTKTKKSGKTNPNHHHHLHLSSSIIMGCCGDNDAVDEGEESILCCALCCANSNLHPAIDCFGCSGKVRY